MAIQVSNTNLSSSFNTWRLNTNQLATVMGNNVVTVGRSGGADRQSYTVGNGHIVGTFTANELRTSTLKGGNTSSDGNLVIAGNTTIGGDGLGTSRSLTVSANTTFNGNVIINTTGSDVFNIGSIGRVRVTGGSTGQYLRKDTVGKMQFDNITLRDLADLSSNSAHIILSSANSSFITGASPHLKFTNGNDTASLFLAIDSTIGDSDLYAQLADSSGDSKFTIANAANTAMATIDSYGGLSANTIQTTSTVGVGGVVTTGYGLEVHQSARIRKNLNVAGNTVLNGTVQISGELSIPSDTEISITRGQFINSVISGNTTLGDASVDEILVRGSITSNVNPKTTGDHYLGTSSKQWQQVNANTVVFYTGLKHNTTTIFGSNGRLHVNNAIATGDLGSNILEDSGVSAASYGSATAIPVITVDAKGLITSATTTTVAGVTGLTYSSANNNIRVSVADGTTFDDVIDPATTSVKGVASFDSDDFTVSSGAVSLKNATTGAVLAVSGTTNEVNVSRSNGTVTVGLPDDVTIAGQLNVGENLIVTGNLVVSGTTTSSETVEIADNIIILNSNETGTPTLDAGITIERGTATNYSWLWDESEGRWTSGDRNIHTSGNFVGTATQANYADLAEKYTTDQEYPAGTVVSIGGSSEVTASTNDTAHSVLGVISENPAYMMNAEADGQYVALKGRVQVKITGQVSKGDRLAPSDTAGIAETNNSKDAWSFAIALENSDGDTVEAVIL